MRPYAPFEKRKEVIKMPKYEIEISEVLQRVVTVEAQDIFEALDKIKQQYENGDIELTPEDLKSVEYEEYEEQIVRQR